MLTSYIVRKRLSGQIRKMNISPARLTCKSIHFVFALVGSIENFLEEQEPKTPDVLASYSPSILLSVKYSSFAWRHYVVTSPASMHDVLRHKKLEKRERQPDNTTQSATPALKELTV